MAFFPFFIDISDKKILIVGGGNVALRKAEKLIPFGAHISVVSPVICGGFSLLQDITLLKRDFRDSDIDGSFAVIAATDDRALNSHIYDICTERHILVNTVDDIDNCGFIFPSLVKEGNVTVGISTGGTAPAFAKYVRKIVDNELDSFTLGIGELLMRVRPLIKRTFPTEKQRAEAADAVIDYCLISDELPSEEELTEWLGGLRTAYENKDRDP